MARCAASDLGVRARRVPDEAVDRGSSRPLADNTAGIETWHDAGETSQGGYLMTRKRSLVQIQYDPQFSKTCPMSGAKTGAGGEPESEGTGLPDRRDVHQ